jgi:hypothetical protein
MDRSSFEQKLKQVGLMFDTGNIHEVELRAGPNAPRSGPGEVLKFWPVQISTTHRDKAK